MEKDLSLLFLCHFHAIRARRRGAVASKSANLHIEGSKVTCIRNFLVRIEIGDFKLFAYTKSLIRRYADMVSARIKCSRPR